MCIAAVARVAPKYRIRKHRITREAREYAAVLRPLRQAAKVLEIIGYRRPRRHPQEHCVMCNKRKETAFLLNMLISMFESDAPAVAFDLLDQ